MAQSHGCSEPSQLQASEQRLRSGTAGEIGKAVATVSVDNAQGRRFSPRSGAFLRGFCTKDTQFRLCLSDMSEPAPTAPPVPDRVSRDDAVAARMARYEAARCRSVQELVAAYGGTHGALATTGDGESTSVLSAPGANGRAGVGIWLKLKGRAHLIAGECRRIWEIVSL
jgi:hypothetical protein